MSRTDAALLLIIAAGLAAACPQSLRRYQVERANGNVSIVVDGADLQRVADTQPEPLELVLARLAGCGATGVAVSEQRLEDLQASGQVQTAPAALMSLQQPASIFPARGLWLTFPGDGKLSHQVIASLRARFPPGRVQAAESGVVLAASGDDLRDVGLALPTHMIAAARRAGMNVAVRLRNCTGITPRGIAFMVDRAASAGARLIIFEGDKVLGYRGLVRVTARALNRPAAPVLYGSVELAQQAGDSELGRLLAGREVRVHSISAEEMDKMSPQTVIRRFVRAARERNVRVCYVRLFQTAQPRLLAYNLEYVRALSSALQRSGFTLGKAEPFERLRVPMVLRLLMQAGAIAGGILLLRRILPVSERASWGLLIVGCVLLGGLVATRAEHGPKAAALLAALVFPSLGMVWVVQGLGNGRQGTPIGGALGAAAIRLLGASGWSLVGGLYVGAMLAERSYLVKVAQFSGIKASSVLPVLLVAAVIVGKMSGRRGVGYLREVRQNFGSLLSRPVLLWHAAAALAIAAAAVLLVLRTGNEPVMKPSASELGMRDSLEELLIARPRTKEFLLGHPALMLGVALAVRGTGGWAALMLIAGAVGQVSITNTFCHLHSPLWLALLRVINGFWLGLLIGSAVTLAAGRLGRPSSAAGGKQPEPADAP